MPRPTDQFIRDTLQRLLLVPFESQHSDHTILLRVDRRTYNEAQHLLAELEPGGATHKPLTRAESEALGALRMATERAQVVADTRGFRNMPLGPPTGPTATSCIPIDAGLLSCV